MGGEAGVSILGPASHKWREGVAEEPADYELANRGMKPGDIISNNNDLHSHPPALQHPLPDLSESPWWEEGQSLQKSPPVPMDTPGQPWQYWHGTQVLTFNFNSIQGLNSPRLRIQ